MSGYIINDFLFEVDVQSIRPYYGIHEKKIDVLNPSLKSYLCDIKLEIDGVCDKWDKNKKLTNKYEYVNTNVHLDEIGCSTTICTYKPISRSYFKMIEILNSFSFVFPTNMQSFHLAEGPGGFIEAISNFRCNKNDKYYGFTLMDKHHDVPKWKKINQFLKNNKNIILEYGPKRDGNLYFEHNLKYFKQVYRNKFDFVTADGGFDYSIDFNKQEESSIKLIFCEVLYALIIQKEGGSFVLKMFDTFHPLSAQILYILSYFYEQVHLFKPNTSREANSEKYVICINMKDTPKKDEIIQQLSINFGYINSSQHLHSLLDVELNSFFLSKIQEINAIFGQQQIENILQTLNYIREDILSNKEKVNKIKRNNVKKCIQWCIQHKQPYLQDLNV